MENAYFSCKITFLEEKNKTPTTIFDFLVEIIGKNYGKAIYRHFSNYRQNYRYRYEISNFIGDLKELSAKLSISKLTGYLSKNYRYRKK